MTDINKCNDAILQMQLDMEDGRGIDNMHQPVSTPAEPQAANRVNPGYKPTPTNPGFSSHCKIDSRTDSATLISFDSLKHVTKEGNVEAGAILIEINEQDYWLPKKLCSNLDLEEGTVYVWTEFLADAKPELLDMISDSNE